MVIKKLLKTRHLLSLFLIILSFPLSGVSAAGTCFCLKDLKAECKVIDQADCSNSFTMAVNGNGVCSWDGSENGCKQHVDEFNLAQLKTPVTQPTGVTVNDHALEDVQAEAYVTLGQLSTTNPQQIIGLAVKALMMFMGSIMFVMVVYAGVMWMTAQGNSERIEKSQKTMIWAALGVAVMLLSYILVNFIFNSIQTGA